MRLRRDPTGYGQISRHDFAIGVRRLGLRAEVASIEGLFDEWDSDGSGQISVLELNKILRTVLPILIVCRIIPLLFWIPSADNPSDDGTRGRKSDSRC